MNFKVGDIVTSNLPFCFCYNIKSKITGIENGIVTFNGNTINKCLHPEEHLILVERMYKPPKVYPIAKFMESIIK